MVRPKSISQKKVIKILKDNGFEMMKSGKHITFKKKTIAGKVLTTWVPHHSEVSFFVMQYIIKQTGISKNEFGLK